MGYAQGPHGGVMGGVASGKSEAEVSAANEGERNANALAAAVKSILSSKEYRALIEKELKKNKNVLDKEIKSILDKNKKAQETVVVEAYKDDLFNTNFNLNIGAPVGSSPGFQGAVTPGVSTSPVSHDFEGLIGQQENEAEEGLKNALGVGLGFNINYDQAPHALDVIEQQNIAKAQAAKNMAITGIDVESFGSPAIGMPTTGVSLTAPLNALGMEEVDSLFEYEDVELKDKSPVVDFGKVVEDRTEFEAMLEKNRAIEAGQKEFETPLGLDFNPVPKDFEGTKIHKRTVEERTKKEANIAKNLTESQNFLNAFNKKKEVLDKLKQVPFTKRTFKQHSKIGKLQRQLNKISETDRYLTAYATVNGMSALGKGILAIAPYGMGMQYTALSKFAIENLGLIDTRTLADIENEIETSVNKPEGQTTEEQTSNVKDSVEGGFWGLLGFAKKNPKIFGPLSGDELWKLVMDEDAFWNYYEQGLVGG